MKCVLVISSLLLIGVNGSHSPEEILVDEPIQRIKALGQISDSKSSLTRSFFSSAHIQAAQLISEWMLDAGMEVWTDAIGNVHGRLGAQDADIPTIVIGSHYDTVADAGIYDGVLGIVSAISAVKYLSKKHGHDGKDGGSPWWKQSVEIVGFTDEEGARFQTTFLGSRALTGGLVGKGLLEVRDKDGQSLFEVLLDNGVDRNTDFQKLAIPAGKMKAYVEVHSEQGPKLRRMGIPLAVVAGIAGQTFAKVSMVGEQNHAGTVPMSMRKDAVAGAAEAIYSIEQICRELDGNGSNDTPDTCGDLPEVCSITNDGAEVKNSTEYLPEVGSMLVCTVGQVNVWPGASNAIAGSVNFSIDVRSGSDKDRKLALSTIWGKINHICSQRNLECDIEKRHEAPAVACSPEVTGRLAEAARKAIAETSNLMKGKKRNHQGPNWSCKNAREENCDHWNIGMEVPTLVSGAGHDALAMVDIGPVAMVFVRDNGISHSPREHVDEPDITAATLTIAHFLEKENEALS